jgi:DNA-binding IscR family transcriptional regulator
VEAVEGPTQINLCIPEGPNCDRKDWCGAHPVWAEAQAALTAVLRRASIAQLAQSTASNLAQLHVEAGTTRTKGDPLHVVRPGK